MLREESLQHLRPGLAKMLRNVHLGPPSTPEGVFYAMLPAPPGRAPQCREATIVSSETYFKADISGQRPYDPMKEPRFTEIATFMRAPLASSLANVDIGLIGVPTDLGVTNRPGARHGPREIRNASSLMRGYNLGLGVNPYELCRIADLGDVRLSHRYDLEKQNEDIEAFYRAVKAAGVLPVSAGGDHSITYPIFRAIAAERPVGMVHIDAHTDTWGEFFGSKFTHGAPFRLAVEAGVLDPKRTIQIGIRGGQNFLDGIEFSRSHGMRVVFIEEFADLGVERVIALAREVVGDAPAYLSFDVDGLDPVYAPGTGTPEVGGITTLEAQRLLRGLRGMNFIGGDVVEVAPPYDQTGNTALVGATMMFEILCLIADRHFGAGKRAAGAALRSR
jgi:guanidinopropionase